MLCGCSGGQWYGGVMVTVEVGHLCKREEEVIDAVRRAGRIVLKGGGGSLGGYGVDMGWIWVDISVEGRTYDVGDIGMT